MGDAAAQRRGKLRILLGYAAGVGKTYKMLEEAQRLKREGHDVAVGYFEPHGRKDTIAKIEGLEMIPRRRINYRGRDFEEMDTDAILARHPEICAVDEFPHTNIPGTERIKRWEDVMTLLDAGIDVLTTMNIQHLESLNDQMREITGVQVRETIPDWVVKQADEVILVDLPPRALLNRLQRGVIYGTEKAERALGNFFKEPALAALREMALRQAAHEIDLRQTEEEHQPGSANAEPENREAILIHITDSPATAAVIRRGKRVADYLKADCFAVCVPPASNLASLPTPMREALERHLDFARKLRIETRVLEGDNQAEALVDFARRNGVTQIFLAKPERRALPFLGKRDLVMDIVRLAQDRQVTVVAERRHEKAD
ncbi:MAG: histidine kinase [Bryobacteraceae bacterium]|jgi:two-component system sensor histidine kinase KdpD